MRSLQMVAALAAVLVVGSSAAHAGNVVRYTDGSLGVVESQKAIAERLDITVTPDALAYGDAWKKAVKTGKPVPVETHTERSAHHFTLTTTTVAGREVVLKQGAVVVENIPTTLRTEENFNLFFIFAGIAVALMALTNLLFLGRHSDAVLGSAVVAIVLTFAAVMETYTTFVAIAILVGVVAAFAVFADEARTHYTASAVFYGAMTLAALIVYF